MNTRYLLFAILCYWISLSSNLLSTTAHIVVQAPADTADFEEAPQPKPKKRQTKPAKENSESSSLEQLSEMLNSFDGDFGLDSATRELQNSNKKTTDSKGKKKGKNNKEKPVVKVEDSEDNEESDNSEAESDESDAAEEEKIVVGNRDDESDESSSTVQPTPTPNSNSNQAPQSEDESNVQYIDTQLGDEFRHFEVQTCTEIKVPLDPKGIELTVNPLDNTQRIMLSSSQITDCYQLLEFGCPQNAKFCQEQDLSESSTMTLGQEVCHHTTAYLYLLPLNAAAPLEFELRVSVTNEVECAADTEQASQPAAADATEENIEQNTGVDNSSHVNIAKILVLSFGISLALCLVFVCYYRYQFRNNKRELCSPPGWCPNFLFPRMSNQMERFMTVNRNTEQEMVTDYQPPVL